MTEQDKTMIQIAKNLLCFNYLKQSYQKLVNNVFVTGKGYKVFDNVSPNCKAVTENALQECKKANLQSNKAVKAINKAQGVYVPKHTEKSKQELNYDTQNFEYFLNAYGFAEKLTKDFNPATAFEFQNDLHGLEAKYRNRLKDELGKDNK